MNLLRDRGYEDLVDHDQPRDNLTMVVPAGKLSIRYPLQELCVTSRKSIWYRNWRGSALTAVRRPRRTTFRADRTRRFSR